MSNPLDFRRGDLADGLIGRIAAESDPDRRYRFLEICGGHAAAVACYGLQGGLPANVDLVHGPACAVCSLPAHRIDQAIEGAERTGPILCAYGDVMQIPGNRGKTLAACRADGADIRQIGSPLEAIAIARAEPTREVILFAVGFEASAVATAATLAKARDERLGNFAVLCAHLVTTAALQFVLENARPESDVDDRIDGVLGPAHVGGLIGSRPFSFFVEEYQTPVVMAGPEPLDVLHGVLMLMRQVNEERFALETQYSRVASASGNAKALDLMATVFEPRRDAGWRDRGAIPYSGLGLRPEFAAFDAETRYALSAVCRKAGQKGDGFSLQRGLKAASAFLVGRARERPETPLGSCLAYADESCCDHREFSRGPRDTGLAAAEQAGWI